MSENTKNDDSATKDIINNDKEYSQISNLDEILLQIDNKYEELFLKVHNNSLFYF